MRRYFPLLAGALLLLGSGRTLAAQAAREDTAAVLAPVRALLNTLATRDTAAARALLAPGFTLVAMEIGGASPPSAHDREDFLRTLTRGTERLLERMWSPVVHVQGPIAVVWTPYDFHVDGQFSHCGIDTFTLLQIGTEWRIASLVYTVQLSGCEPSPLGTPR